jgi:hypothetical protein
LKENLNVFGNEALEKWGLTDANGEGFGGGVVNTNAINTFNQYAITAMQAGVEYAITGQTSLNLLQLMVGKDSRGNQNRVGLLELGIGKDGLSMRMGMGGRQVDSLALGDALAGFDQFMKVSGFKLGGEEGRSTLNMLNGLGWSGDTFNAGLGRSIFNGLLDVEYGDMTGNAAGARGYYQDGNTIHIARSMLGMGRENAARLASVVAHEGTHVAGNTYEGIGYEQSMRTYAALSRVWEGVGNAGFWSEMEAGYNDPRSWTENADGETQFFKVVRQANGQAGWMTDSQSSIFDLSALGMGKVSYQDYLFFTNDATKVLAGSNPNVAEGLALFNKKMEAIDSNGLSDSFSSLLRYNEAIAPFIQGIRANESLSTRSPFNKPRNSEYQYFGDTRQALSELFNSGIILLSTPQIDPGAVFIGDQFVFPLPSTDASIPEICSLAGMRWLKVGKSQLQDSNHGMAIDLYGKSPLLAQVTGTMSYGWGTGVGLDGESESNPSLGFNMKNIGNLPYVGNGDNYSGPLGHMGVAGYEAMVDLIFTQGSNPQFNADENKLILNVIAGQVSGYSGTTGYSSDYHAHYAPTIAVGLDSQYEIDPLYLFSVLDPGYLQVPSANGRERPLFTISSEALRRTGLPATLYQNPQSQAYRDAAMERLSALEFGKMINKNKWDPEYSWKEYYRQRQR